MNPNSTIGRLTSYASSVRMTQQHLKPIDSPFSLTWWSCIYTPWTCQVMHHNQMYQNHKHHSSSASSRTIHQIEMKGSEHHHITRTNMGVKLSNVRTYPKTKSKAFMNRHMLAWYVGPRRNMLTLPHYTMDQELTQTMQNTHHVITSCCSSQTWPCLHQLNTHWCRTQATDPHDP